jgi:pimeloyl-ACP methyl ester carboxylesterase
MLRRILHYAALAVFLLFTFAYVAYWRDIRQARERISIGSTVVETRCGSIEYGTAGEGRPVLAVHGAGGGFDQGLEIGAALAQSGVRLIAPSRFGYLGTPLPDDGSPGEQADAYACLLDALHIDRVAVIGASAGAPSSMQFAIRHPERTSALVLLVPAAYPSHTEQRLQGTVPEQSPATTRWMFDVALKSDFLFWLTPRLSANLAMRTVLGTPPDVVKNASVEERARVDRVLEHIQPISARRLGLLNDARITPSLPQYELERITAPTLIIGVQDDIYGTWEGAQHTADCIPDARFIGYPTGGHLWVGHQHEVMAEIAKFLSMNGK